VSWRLPVADLVLTDEDTDAVLSELRPQGAIMGPRTLEFESAMAARCGAAHAIAVASGTAALHVACAAAGLGPGDEVIVPALTFLATANAPRYVGASVLLCDVRSPAEPVLDPDAVLRAIGPRTRAVMPVHWWGYAAPMVELQEICDAHGLLMIEDCAQGIGARCAGIDRQMGTVGRAGCLSFFSKKQLAVGEGGMVLTDDNALAARARALRGDGPASSDGTEPPWDADGRGAGLDYRFDDVRAALGLSRLRRLEADIAHRRAAVRAYRERLAGVDGVTVPWTDADVELSSHFAFAVVFQTTELRETVREELAAAGIQTTRYPVLHALTEYAPYAAWGSLPHAEAVADRHLVLPLSSHIAPADVDLVCELVRHVVGVSYGGGSRRFARSETRATPAGEDRAVRAGG